MDLLEDFCKRFYWIKEHPDYQTKVRVFLTLGGREPAASDERSCPAPNEK